MDHSCVPKDFCESSASCNSPLIDFFCSCKVMSLPAWSKFAPCAAIFVCLLFLPPLLSWVTSLSSVERVTLDLRGLEMKALYKKATRNADGSIDLTVNIPIPAALVKQLLDGQGPIMYNLTVVHRLPASSLTSTSTSEDEEEAASVNGSRLSQAHEAVKRRTYYPLTTETPYILNNPALCQGTKPLHLLVIVHTATDNFQRRRLIRETWAARDLLPSRSVRLVFLLGLTTDASTQSSIENEQVVYGDLVQGRFKDSYHNLTLKGVLAYRWIQQYCSRASLVLKVDDDMYINPFLLHQFYLPRYSRANRTMACHVRPANTSPIQRNKPNKWHVEEFEFRGYKSYPFSYCNGYVVFITPDIIRAMYHAAHSTPFFWVDDVYLYGKLPVKVGQIKHDNIKLNMTLSSHTGLRCYRQLNCTLLAAHAPDENTLSELWRLSLTQAKMAPQLKGGINPVYFTA